MKNLLQKDARHLAMAASLAVSLLMLAGKLTAYAITGSAAIYSDALESVIHLFATGFAGFSLWYAIRPEDDGHPYGHGKIAYVSSGFEGGLILLASLAILYEAIRALVKGPELRQLDVGLLITAGLCLVNLLLGLTLVQVGRRTNSLVLRANGQHVLTDMWTSLGVLVGVFLVWTTDLRWLDPVVAILMALNILWTAFQLMKQAVAGLLEAVDPAETRMLVQTLEQARAAGTIRDYHQLRHRKVNDRMFIEYHLLFPGDLPLTEAHGRSHVVEAAITAAFAPYQVFVTAHLEPEAHELAHPSGHREGRKPEGRSQGVPVQHK